MQLRNKWFLSIFTGILAVFVVVGALTIRTVSAQSPTPTPGTPDSQAAPGSQAAPDKALRQRGELRKEFNDENLAAALGITTDQLQAAVETANAEAIKEAVAQGLITQEQADQMNANGMGKHGLGRFGKLGGAAGTAAIDYDALLAKALNITTDKLAEARQAAFNASLDAALKDGTLTQEQVDRIQGERALANDSAFQSALQSAYEAAVKQAVTNGVITQAQADAILANQNGGFFGRGFGPGFDRGFGPGGHGGPGGPPIEIETQDN